MLRNKIGNANVQQLDSNLYPQVLDKIYSNVNFQKIRYQILNNKSYLDEIKSSKHYITPHFQGYNYLLIFMVINNVKYNLLIMKNLKFWKEQNNIQDIKIYKFDTNNSYIDYNTISIFDGKMINNSNKSSFIINDIYNKTMENLTLPEKLDQVNDILNKIKINDISVKLINDDDITPLLKDKKKKEIISDSDGNELEPNSDDESDIDNLDLEAQRKLTHFENKRVGLQEITIQKLKDELYNNRELVFKELTC